MKDFHNLYGKNIKYLKQTMQIIGVSRGYLQCYSDRDNIVYQFALGNLPKKVKKQVKKIERS